MKVPMDLCNFRYILRREPLSSKLETISPGKAVILVKKALICPLDIDWTSDIP